MPRPTALVDDEHELRESLGRGQVFGDDVVAAAMIDRLVHHAEVVALEGDGYSISLTVPV